MPRENSFSDSDGRSLTPDLDEENDFDMGPGSLTASPVAENTLPTQSRFEYPPPNTQPNAKDGTVPRSPSSPGQKQPLLTEADSAQPAAPSRKATIATVYSVDGTPKRTIPPIERFRQTVRKVMHMNRGSSAMSLGGIGAEPGIDPRRSSAYLNYGHIRAKCTIDIVDYSAVRSSFGRMHNRSLVEYLNDPKASAREPWVKVRWINIGGISWDVMSAVALAYDLHPLALEDVLHQRKQARSKADYYLKHLFIRILRHTLAPQDEEDLTEHYHTIAYLPRSASPDNMYDDIAEEEEEENEDEDSKKLGSIEADEDKTLAGSRFSTKRRVGTFRKAAAARDVEMGMKPERGRTMTLRTRRIADVKLVENLRRGEHVHVKVQPFCIFLLRDGTVISINKSPDLDFTTPILARLRQRDTGLRATADPSLLVQSLLDLVVDQAMEVVDEYQHKILKLEHDILIRPSMKSVRYLHMMSGDLTLHKRTLEPIKTLVYGLRRYDVDRCAALIDSQGLDTSKVQGFMSHKAKIYLADVYDHMDYIIGSLDMFSTIAENLINYTFNMASYEMNIVMRRLTLATIIFLPLTLLTGYFGMNFDPMWSVNQNSDVLFWKIAIPVMAVVIPIFMWSDIQQAAHYLKKRWLDRKLRKTLHNELLKKTQ